MHRKHGQLDSLLSPLPPQDVNERSLIASVVERNCRRLAGDDKPRRLEHHWNVDDVPDREKGRDEHKTKDERAESHGQQKKEGYDGSFGGREGTSTGKRANECGGLSKEEDEDKRGKRKVSTTGGEREGGEEAGEEAKEEAVKEVDKRERGREK